MKTLEECLTIVGKIHADPKTPLLTAVSTDAEGIQIETDVEAFYAALPEEFRSRVSVQAVDHLIAHLLLSWREVASSDRDQEEYIKAGLTVVALGLYYLSSAHFGTLFQKSYDEAMATKQPIPAAETIQ